MIFLNPIIFVIVLGVCVILSVLVGQWSVWRYLHRKYKIPWSLNVTDWIDTMKEVKRK